MRRVLVLGGSGFVGRQLCRRLAALATPPPVITVPTRANPPDTPPSGVETVTAQVTDPTALAQLVQGHDTVVNLVAILHGSAQEFERIHVDFTATLARACVASGRVAHLIHVSAVGADSDGPSMYQRSKGRGEAALTRLCAAAGLSTSIIRPSVIFGLEDRFINTFARIQRLAPFVPLAGATTRFQPVWVDDVAHAIARIVVDPASGPPVLETCGPEILTLGQLVAHAGRWSGHRRPIIPLPLSIGRWQASLMEWLPGKTLMSRDNIDSMRIDNVASGRLPGLEQLGIRPSRLEDVFPTRRASDDQAR